MFLNKPFFPITVGCGGEDFEMEVYQNEIEEGNVVVDVGANVGYYTLVFAKLV